MSKRYFGQKSSARADTSASAAAARARLQHRNAKADLRDVELQEHEMHAATQSTLLELLSNPAVQPSCITHLLTAFPVPERMLYGERELLAKQCWEHLLDYCDPTRMKHVYGKMKLMRKIKLYCPTELFRQHCHLEQVQLLVTTLGSQVDVGIFLAHLRRSLSADGQHIFRHESSQVQQLHRKLEAADLLMVLHTMSTGNVFSMDARQLQQLKLVHLARHGPAAELESALCVRTSDAGQQLTGSSAAAAAAAASPSYPLGQARELIRGSYQGFPMLFQPLIACHCGWLNRLSVLLRAGADASVTYEPWSCSALHMLFYRKSSGCSSSRKLSEVTQVQALLLLLQHGAKTVLNLADKNTASSDGSSSSNAPSGRTALLQAAAAGRFQACRTLLAAGADANAMDSSNQSMLDYLFYLKHSSRSVHQRVTAGYTCMQLYGLVNDFHLHALVSDELEQDCRSCGRCRFLLASCAIRNQDASSDVESAPCGEELLSSSSEEEAESRNGYRTAHAAGHGAAAAASACMQNEMMSD
jgi:hypothetical protein